MADPQRLLTGLEDYHRELTSHLRTVQDEFNAVRNVGEQFITEYEGDAAEQFKAGWARTKQKFDTYTTDTDRISAMLDERIESLRGVAREENDLIG